MPTSDEGIVITIDAKRLMAITILAIITVSTLYSYIVALFAFIAPNPGTYLFDISGDTYDTSNNLQDTFSRKNIVRVKAAVEKATGYYTNPPPDYTSYTSLSGTSPYRVFIQVMNPSNQPYKSCYTAAGSLTVGVSKEYTADFYIDLGAPTGVYRVFVYVWSDNLPNGVSLTPTIESFTFTVT
jgi:hypothetical protein